MEINLNGDSQSNLVLFEEISSAKFRFFDAIAASRQRGSAVKVADLRQDYILEIAKFYYLLKLCKIDSPKKLRELAIFHNRKIEALIKIRENKPKKGPHRDPLHSALFNTDQKLDRLEAHSGTNRIELSQSSLAKFMAEHMSSETCRSAVRILSETGYLSRAKSPFGAILIRSTGRIEEHFETYVRSLGKALGP